MAKNKSSANFPYLVALTVLSLLLILGAGTSVYLWKHYNNQRLASQSLADEKELKIKELEEQIAEKDQAYQTLRTSNASLEAENRTLKNQPAYSQQPTTQRQKPVTCSSFGSSSSITCYNPY